MTSDVDEDTILVMVTDGFLHEMFGFEPFTQTRKYPGDVRLLNHLGWKYYNCLINTWRKHLNHYSLEAALVKMFTWCLKRYYTHAELPRLEEHAAILSVLLLERLDGTTRPKDH